MDFTFEVLRNNLGMVSFIIRRPDGSMVAFDPQTKKFDEDDLVTQSLREWEKENGALDLSDRSPDPVTVKTIYRINQLLPPDRTIESDRFPGDINYNTELVIGLTTKTVDYFGLRVAQISYQTINPEDGNAIADLPVVFERYKYKWDTTLKIPTERIKEIQFYDSDGGLSKEAKILPKPFYSASDKNTIVYYRRQEIVNWLIARATEIGLRSQVVSFFEKYRNQSDDYILYGNNKIISTITNATDSWLDLDTKTQLGTIRNSIVVSFTKALGVTSDLEVDAYLKSLNLL